MQQQADSEDEKSPKQQEAAKDEDDFEDFEQKDDGFIKLVLSLLARMCDGQHAGLQVGRLIVFIFVLNNSACNPICWCSSVGL